jgi:hypothetical protein
MSLQVRGMHRVKLCDVTMDDVLEFRVVSLAHRDAPTNAPEPWTHRFSAAFWRKHRKPHQDTLILSKSFKTAVDTFFSEASPLELNVPSDVRHRRVRIVELRVLGEPQVEIAGAFRVVSLAHRDAPKSFKTAVDTFFSEASPLELNVPSDVRREIDERRGTWRTSRGSDRRCGRPASGTP